MKQILLNERPHVADACLSNYTIMSKPSSNVDCYGIDCDNLNFFIQFRNGVCYFFSGVPIDVLNGAVDCESIGKYFNGKIARQYESRKVLNRLVTEEKVTIQ
ncbi:MAG TPA: KTSC domain-containing protein [Sphingobacteriaceae bacterium]